MKLSGAILAIALAWCFLQGEVTTSHLLLGCIIALAILLVTRQFNGLDREIRQIQANVVLVVYVMFELVISSVRIMWDILTPGVQARPRVIRIPIDDLTDTGVTILANAISLTPGSLALNVSEDGQFLYVHHMYAQDAEAARNALHSKLGGKVRTIGDVLKSPEGKRS